MPQAVKTFDVFLSARRGEAHCVQAQGKNQEEALASLKLEDGEMVTSVCERPPRQTV
jgi:hypothetical protein